MSALLFATLTPIYYSCTLASLKLKYLLNRSELILGKHLTSPGSVLTCLRARNVMGGQGIDGVSHS